jgi:hypothetical protein
MIRGRVMEIMENGTTRGRGDHEFVQLPWPGDRVVLGTDSGDLEMLRVVRIKHLPIRVPHTKLEGSAPLAMVYVEWAEEWNEKV